MIKDRRYRRAVVLEAKAAGSDKLMKKECSNALLQIEEKQYAKKVEAFDYKQIIK